MKSFFSDEGKKDLDEWKRLPHVAVFDFDGTLAPIVDIPSEARMTEAVSHALRNLMKSVPVVIISGRAGADLETRLGELKTRLVGNHGMEGVAIREEVLSLAQMIRKAWVIQLKEYDLGRGITLEDKQFSLTFHYRAAKYRSYARNKIVKIIAALDPPPRIVLGKSVVNLIPPGMPHKGDALLKIMNALRVERAIFFGDDVTDEDVFAMNDPRVMTVRIGRKAGTSAGFFLRRQNEMARAIRALTHTAFSKNTPK